MFAQLDADLTPQKVTQTAYAMGVTTHLDSLPAEAIGGLTHRRHPAGDGRRVLDAGQRRHPRAGDDHQQGRVPRRQRPTTSAIRKTTRVFTPGEAYAGTQVLKGVITSGTGTAAGYGCPAAGKTGTANNLANAWFVGYTPRMATAVWVGYPQGNSIPMADGFGGTLAAPIWHDYMQTASGDYCGDFPHARRAVPGHRLLRPLRGHRRLQHRHAGPGQHRRPGNRHQHAPAARGSAPDADHDIAVQEPDAVRPAAPARRRDGNDRRPEPVADRRDRRQTAADRRRHRQDGTGASGGTGIAH